MSEPREDEVQDPDENDSFREWVEAMEQASLELDRQFLKTYS